MKTIKLYRHALSGHAHRAEVFLSLLNLPYQLINVDLANGEHKQAEFLNKNIFAQVPVIEDGDVTLSDSNAILYYLAKQYDTSHSWMPDDILLASEVQRFLSIASGQIAYGPCAARLVNVFNAPLDHQVAITISHQILAQLNQHLEGKNWLVGEQATIADVANYTYIAHAPEGGVSLQDYPNIQNWITRFEALQGFIPMQKTQAGLSA